MELFSFDLPNNPMAMHMSPDGSVWWVAHLIGQLIEVRSYTVTMRPMETSVLDACHDYFI